MSQQLTAEAGNGKVKLRALLVEDDSADAELVLLELRRSGFDLSWDWVQTPFEFRERLRAKCPDVVLADYNLGHWRGMETLDIMREEGLEVPLILVSGALGDVTAVECIKRGATDYVLKDSLARLPVSIYRALQEKRMLDEGKRSQENLARKAEELKRSNRDLEQFAYVASHDLQEPLRMIASYTQLLAERYHGKLDQQADKYIHYAVDGAVRMQALIQDLLAFSRAGRQDSETKSTDCNAVVEDALKSLRTAVSESGAVIRYEGLPRLMANETQLRQVFQNLIGNAVKFRGPDPLLIQIEAERQDRDWLFSVKDNGIGIAPEHADGVFTIFKRLHTRQEYPGNGIGLAICKRIIEQHGGRIWVEARAGPGTTFRFTLPVAAQQPSQERVPGKEAHSEDHAPSLAG
jgi:signal transduction histidine kinase